MKIRYLLSILPFAVVFGCAKVQVYDTAAPQLIEESNRWVFENEFTKITYIFWANKGVLSFAVYNKTDKPLYVDWKNSSFIHNGDKLNYWADESFTSTDGYYKGFIYSGPALKGWAGFTGGVQRSMSKTTKPERITFIPPRSYYYNESFYILSGNYYKINKNTASKKLYQKKEGTTKHTYYERTFDQSNSPLKFRNYLAFSFAEDSRDFSFVDNEFYVSAIKLMKRGTFRGKTTNFLEDEPATYEYPFNKGTAFYVEMKPEVTYD